MEEDIGDGGPQQQRHRPRGRTPDPNQELSNLPVSKNEADKLPRDRRIHPAPSPGTHRTQNNNQHPSRSDQEILRYTWRDEDPRHSQSSCQPEDIPLRDVADVTVKVRRPDIPKILQELSELGAELSDCPSI